MHEAPEEEEAAMTSSDDGLCPGVCNRQWRIAAEAYDAALAKYAADMEAWLAKPGDERGKRPVEPEQPDTPVTRGDPVWCSRCTRTIRASFQELDDLASVLAADIDGHRPAAPLGPNGKPPLTPTGAVDTLDELFGALVNVEDNWREFRRYAPRPHRARGGHARRLSINFLLDELDDILLHPGSVTFGLGVLAWQRRLRKHTKSDPARTLSLIRCPSCKERQVRAKDDGWWECLCGRLLNQAEHDREQEAQVDEHEQQEAHAS
jgi:ribosomal protein L37AE/L43A